MKVIVLAILLMVSFFTFSQEKVKENTIENQILSFLPFREAFKKQVQFSELVKCDAAKEIEKPNIFSQVIDYAQSKIGIRYGRKGFDCSGLVAKAFNSIGFELPHSSKMQSNFGERVSKSEAQPGDLIFFSSPKSKKKVGHVGIITNVSNNVVHFVHAAVKGGVMISKLTEGYYQKHFMLIKRNQIEPQLVQN